MLSFLCTARPAATTVPGRLNSRRAAVCQARFFRDGTLVKTSDWRRRSSTVAIRKHHNDGGEAAGRIVVTRQDSLIVAFERRDRDDNILSATTAVRRADGWDVYTTVDGVLSTDTVSAEGRASALLAIIHEHGYVGRALRI